MANLKTTGMALATIGLPDWAIALLLVLFAVPASEGALGFFNTVVLQFLQPTRLVGYEFKEGVPAEARTLVVVPTLIGSRDDVEDAVRKLEVHHLANMTGEVHFALLSDWLDSKVEQDTADDEILAFAQSEIALRQRRKHRLHRGDLAHVMSQPEDLADQSFGQLRAR